MELEALAAVHEQRLDSIERRVSKLEDISNGLTELRLAIEKTNGNVDRVVTTIETMATKQKEHDERLEKIEQEPVDMWKTVTKQIIGLIISAIVGATLAGLIK